MSGIIEIGSGTLVAGAGLGGLLGAGLVLVLAPLLWPSRSGVAVQRRSGHRMRTLLAQAGLGSVPVSASVAVLAVLGLAGAGLAQGLLNVTALTVVGGVASAIAPLVVVGWRASSRRRANRTVWPDVVDHLVSALRSGLALPDSVSSLAHSGPLATRTAFAVFEREYRATGNFARCVTELKESLADPTAEAI